MTKANKRTLFLICCVIALVAIVLGVTPQIMSAKASTQADISSYFSGGDGSESNPYLISNEAELRHIIDTRIEEDGYYYIDANFKLLNDITITVTPWAPIDGLLRGTIDGNGKTIRNMVISNSDKIGQGFINTNETGTIKNLNFDNVTITYTGTFPDFGGNGAGIGVVAGINHGYITNCKVTNAKIMSNSNYSCNIGGICGSVYFGSVIDCISYATISGSGSLGGISGSVLYNGNVTNCTSYATVSGSGSLGGTAGNVSNSTITNCTSYITASVSGSGSVGGIAGNVSNSTITGCTSSATVSGSGSIGGIAGKVSNSVITDCIASGTVSFLYNGSSGNAGGIVGEAKTGSIIQACNNYSLVKYGSSKNNDKNFQPCMAQIVGLLNSSTVTNCYCYGNTDFTNLQKLFLSTNQKLYCSNGAVGRTI